jgi:anti-sigma B factor antagonist
VLFPADPGPPRPEQFLAVNPRPGDGHHVVLDVVGEVDAFTAPLLRACLRTQLSRPGLRELVLDVGGVEFLGAAGVSLIFEVARRCRRRGLRFRLLTRGRSDVLLPLRMAGVLDGLEVGPEVAAPLPLAGSASRA